MTNIENAQGKWEGEVDYTMFDRLYRVDDKFLQEETDDLAERFVSFEKAYQSGNKDIGAKRARAAWRESLMSDIVAFGQKIQQIEKNEDEVLFRVPDIRKVYQIHHRFLEELKEEKYQQEEHEAKVELEKRPWKEEIGQFLHLDR